MGLKTFKMLSFELMTEKGRKQIPLEDGIVINQENSHKSWILELFISEKYKVIFEQLQASNEVFDVQVVISFPDNEPAPFRVVVGNIHVIGDRISVLLKGTITRRRTKYAEQLLKLLLEENLSGKELFERFEKGMRDRPLLKD